MTFWPLIKVLPVRTHFKFVRLAKYFAPLSLLAVVASLALAVDANVLIYERMRDEARAGHSVLAATDHGMRRALISIVDANVTTLIAGGIMYYLGAGPIRGFAWTLSVGVFTSVFSAVFVTQVLLGWWLKVAKPKKLPIL